ncbi:MAG: FAD binding domain-containing protein, partial [Cyanobacteria bacterium HKST-UBA01]|nr:FAD binding domain-containing protein [Cyanobacteria bacterium HKST-UBA01]
SISNVDELDYISGSEKAGREIVEVGGRVSLAELESYLLKRHGDLDYIFWVFGSPQIRNSGTLVGNIANASPIADTPPYLFVMDAEIIAIGPKGERCIPITEFYSGYKTLTLAKDEVIKAIRFALPGPADILKLYKISRRQHLDISAFTAAIRLKREGEKIVEAAVAYGGVAATVLRMKEVEEFLKDKPYSLETFEEAGRIAADSIKPLSDVRGSSPYRSQLAEN